MNLHITKSKNAESFYICRSYVKANGSTTSTIIRKLGTLEHLLIEHGPTRDDVITWAKNEVKIEMSLQAKSVAENLGSDKNKLKNKNFQKPYIFEEDLISPDGGDDFLLFEILKNSFIRQNYSESQKELLRLSGTKISEEVLNRATFYLGESYYFQGNYQNAVKNFLKVYEVFPELSKKWITSSLDLLEIPEF